MEKDANQTYVEHLENQTLDLRTENFELREKILKLNENLAKQREQIENLAEKNRKLNQYATFFGNVGNTIHQLYAQFEKAKKVLPIENKDIT